MKHKTLTSACVLITGLLIASASALAQVTPAEQMEVYKNPLVLPSENPRLNFLAEVGVLYIDTKLGDQYRAKDNSSLYGINLLVGYRLNEWHKLNFEIGILAGSEKKFGSSRVTYSEVPMLARYDLCLPLTKNRGCELRLSPAIGSCSIGANYDNYVTRPIQSGYYYIDGSDSGSALAYGAGVAITAHINARFYIDAGYRFLAVGSVEMKYTEIKAQTTHSLAVSFGVKF